MTDYNEDFYKEYKDYLLEPQVRRNHHKAFEIFSSLAFDLSLDVIDFGCGVGEYPTYGRYSRYFGVDRIKASPYCHRTMDYTNLEAIVNELNESSVATFNTFISLFSSECCLNVEDKYTLYNDIFAKFPTIQYGMVSGFFYEDNQDQLVVAETGGIESYQTLEKQSSYTSPVFQELRMYMRTPSKMFGDKVVEVWKFFTRTN